MHSAPKRGYRCAVPGSRRDGTTEGPDMNDSRGTKLEVGDLVRVIFVDPARGALHDMVQMDATVVDFGRTRVTLDVCGRTGTDAVGPECVRKVATSPDLLEVVAKLRADAQELRADVRLLDAPANSRNAAVLRSLGVLHGKAQGFERAADMIEAALAGEVAR